MTGNDLTVHQAVIAAQEGLKQLRANQMLAKRIRRDFDTEVATFGKTITVPKYGAVSAHDKVPGASVTVQDLTSTSVSVVLNKHKEATWIIEDVEKAFARDDVLAGYMQSSMKAVAEAVESDIFALYSGFSHSVGSAATALTDATLALARKSLFDSRAPVDENWTAVIASKDTNALLALDRFTTAEKVGGATKLADGALGKIYNFNMFESQLIPTTSAGSPAVLSTHNIAFHRDFAALVVRPLPEIPAGMGSVSAVVSDPESGISVRVRMSYDTDRGGVKCTTEILYGVAELRDELAVTILT